MIRLFDFLGKGGYKAAAGKLTAKYAKYSKKFGMFVCFAVGVQALACAGAGHAEA
jgi:hypothetical protein